MKKILIGSPIHQNDKILSEFLLSIKNLDLEDYDIVYYFIDDNSNIDSSNLLSDFSRENKNVILKKSTDFSNNVEIYECNSIEHKWKTSLINKVIMFKNKIIDYAKINDFDYLFLIDSDILLNKNTIKHLISREVDIVSNIFWTQWVRGGGIFPQVWIQDTNSFYVKNWDKEYNNSEINQMTFDFVNSLKIPGIYEVGGLGACTLISKHAIQSGVNFSIIDNVSFWGEDRHFCIRARVLGLKLYVDTVYPAFHIYREELLDRVESFKKNGFTFDLATVSGDKYKKIISKYIEQFFSKFSLSNIKLLIKSFFKRYYSKKRIISKSNKVVLSMIVKNESKNFLESVLKEAVQLVDEAVIIDDASTDNTVEICEKLLKNIPHRIIRNKKSMFSVEYKLRMKQWKETLKSNPDWILFLDADDIFENKMKKTN